MNKNLKKILMDSASLIVVISAFLYILGIGLIYGKLSALGLTEVVFKADFYHTIVMGFFSIILAPYFATFKWLISFVFLIPLLSPKFIKIKLQLYRYVGIFMFILLQVIASFTTGKEIGIKNLKNISNAYNEK